MSTPEILAEVKRRVMAVEPKADVILYGSYARGDQRPDSDIDLLILVDQGRLNYQDRKRINLPLFGLELESGIMISPYVLPRSLWVDKHKGTPLYKEIEREGRVL